MQVMCKPSTTLRCQSNVYSLLPRVEGRGDHGSRSQGNTYHSIVTSRQRRVRKEHIFPILSINPECYVFALNVSHQDWVTTEKKPNKVNTVIYLIS